MKVVHVAEAYGGGLLQMVAELAEGGVAAGHDVLVAYGVRPETPPDPGAGLDPRVRWVRLPWTSRRPGAQAAAGRALRALLVAERPDVVHLHSSFGGAVGVTVTPRGVPAVFSPHAFASALPEGGAARRRVVRALEAHVCRRATLVGTQSEVEADLARELGARDVLCIVNGIRELDPGRLVTRDDAAVTAAGRPVVVANGRTVPQRRPEAVARILAAVAGDADVAWLGGGGGDRGVAGADALRAAGVEPTGWLPREEVLRRTGEATAYLHWTAWDGLPISVLEALALDVPVVASDIAPNRELLGPEGVCATEAEAVARLRLLATDPGERLRVLAAQRARRERFSAAEMVRRWHAAYAELAPHAAPGVVVPPDERPLVRA